MYDLRVRKLDENSYFSLFEKTMKLYDIPLVDLLFVLKETRLVEEYALNWIETNFAKGKIIYNKCNLVKIQDYTIIKKLKEETKFIRELEVLLFYCSNYGVDRNKHTVYQLHS